MNNYLTQAPVAIEAPHPYIRHYRAPIDAGYSNGYRMSPYQKSGYGDCGCGGGCGCSDSIGCCGGLGATTASSTGKVLALTAAGLVISYFILKQIL